MTKTGRKHGSRRLGMPRHPGSPGVMMASAPSLAAGVVCASVTGWVALSVVLGARAMLASAYGQVPATGPVPAMLRVRIQAIAVCDDDGQRPARVRPADVRRWVEFASRTFVAARIRFVFDEARDFATRRDTVINNITGTGDRNWREARDHADEVAARYPDKLVVYFRHGPGPGATGGGFSWVDYNFVVMPGWKDASHCGHPHVDALAHEIGHYLGLGHTFAAEPFASAADAERWLAERNSNPNAFDGDGFSDTPPDPGIRPHECERIQAVSLNGVQFALPRRNIMSYYDERDTLSPMQIERVRWVLRKRLEGRMALPANAPRGPTFEAEKLTISQRVDCDAAVQPMAGFGVGRWSGDSQVFVGARENASLTFVLPVELTGRYRVRLFATLAPDYGQIRAWLDDQSCGDAIDTYAPIVLPSGPVELGNMKLTRGERRLKITVVGKNPASRGAKFGIDCVELWPEP